MAKVPRHILVAVRDLDRAPRHALARAAALARAVPGTSIELFHAYDSLRGAAEGPRHLERLAHENLNAWIERRLARLARSPAFAGLPVRVHAVHDHPAHEAIVRRVRTTGADLVVIEFHPHRVGMHIFPTHTDWELVRACPCALLVAKPRRLRPGAPVVAAIDPRHANDKPARLDRRILAAADGLAAALGAPVHACHAYVPLSVQLAASATGSEGVATAVWIPPEIDAAQRRSATRALGREAARAGIPPARRHLLALDPTTALLALTRRLRAGTVVMGAISRSGLRRLLIGSTAERALVALDTDVLVVKPAGFRTPVPSRIARVLARLRPAV